MVRTLGGVIGQVKDMGALLASEQQNALVIKQGAGCCKEGGSANAVC